MEFTKAFPNETGISSVCIEELLTQLTKRQVPLHSFLLLHHDKLITEAYFAPYDAAKKHRMFSITKSFTAVAIGLLIDEGKLSLSDPIVDYFPDKLPPQVHPWIAAMTIEDMLMMRTCHASTTYKINSDTDWVKSFFTTPPTHPSGTIFHYDTSSAHTLCALVERLTGMDMLSYLRQKLSSLDLSKDSYLLTDPFGVSLGGSGLVAYSMDLLKFGYFIAHDGCVDGKQLLSASYINRITSHLSDTKITASAPFESHGYGMQFWRISSDAYMCYGMGGQFILFYPSYDFICVTTADTQGIAGANQQIFDAISEYLLPNIKQHELPYTDAEVQQYQNYLSSLHLTPLPAFSHGFDRVRPLNCDAIYHFSRNPMGFSTMQLYFSAPLDQLQGSDYGTLSYTLNGRKCQLVFGFNHYKTSIFPIYQQKYFACASWVAPETLYIKIHVSDAYLGTVHLELSFHDQCVTVFMKKNEESLFQEYSGHLFGLVTRNPLHSI